MSNAALRLQIGARIIATIPRRLVRVGMSLDAALAGCLPQLPPLRAADDGYLLTSVPQVLSPVWRGLLFERQRYTRYYVDLTIGETAWRAGLSGQTRSTLKRKAKKLASAAGGRLDVRRFRTAEQLASFHPVARALAEKTYQERLMAAGLPGDEASVQKFIALAAADCVRAWLLFVNDAPAAYLWCGADGDTLRYDYVGHDPAFAALSPGSVLMEAALIDLFKDRFARFDFTEGEGQHKRLMASGGVACRDLLLLRPTIGNRSAVALVSGFDAAVGIAKKAAALPALHQLAKRVRRA